MSILLLVGNPDAYITFCQEHPIFMCKSLRRETCNGGAGDIRPPSPVADAFFRLLHLRGGGLPTQEEFWNYCASLKDWAPWLAQQTSYAQRCFRARLYRNFYPSFVDSLHVWSLLGTRYCVDGRQVFDQCIIDTRQDVITKTDILVYRLPHIISIALRVESPAATRAALRYKPLRGGYEDTTKVVLTLPLTSRPLVGGKRWYHWPDDFQPLFHRAGELGIPLPSLQERDTHG